MDAVRIHEVGPRDALQLERLVVPMDVKEDWICRAVEAGVDLVQVGSFVRPEKVPQMADTDALVRRLVAERPCHGVFSGLVLNERGLERALACGVDVVCLGASASDTHSRRNTGMGSEEATKRIVATAQAAVAAGKPVQVSVQSAFGCGYEGEVPEDRVLGMVWLYLDAGLRSISLADTAGHAHPDQVERLFGAIRELDDDVECTCHFHNTYGLGMANIFAALRAGVSAVETSFGGLGGCPFTRVPAGNVATEDFVHALQREGARLDLHLDALIDIARDVASFFGRALPGCVYKTGPIPALAHRVAV